MIEISEIIDENLFKCFPSIEESINNPFFKIITLKFNNIPIGYISYYYIYDRIEIEYVLVSDMYRKKGYGSLLLENLIKIAQYNKCTNITLEVRTSNIAAKKLYKKFGFKEVSIRKNYYNDEDGILMIKELEV